MELADLLVKAIFFFLQLLGFVLLGTGFFKHRAGITEQRLLSLRHLTRMNLVSFRYLVGGLLFA